MRPDDCLGEDCDEVRTRERYRMERDAALKHIAQLEDLYGSAALRLQELGEKEVSLTPLAERFADALAEVERLKAEVAAHAEWAKQFTTDPANATVVGILRENAELTAEVSAWKSAAESKDERAMQDMTAIGDEWRKRVESLTAEVATNAAAAAKLTLITNEIDCRIQHGAESGGHLEGIMALLRDGG